MSWATRLSSGKQGPEAGQGSGTTGARPRPANTSAQLGSGSSLNSVISAANARPPPRRGPVGLTPAPLPDTSLIDQR